MRAMPIKDSELIISSKGTIYHLDLLPEQLADTVITVGDPGRVAEVSKYFDRTEHKAVHREFISHTGYVGGKRITVLSTGIGPDNIDIVFNELDALVNIDFQTRLPKADKRALHIIRLGTCGSLQADVPVGSLVASAFGLGLDNLMHYYRRTPNPDEAFILQAFMAHAKLTQSPVQPYLAEGSIQLRKHFSGQYVPGITVTCPGFYGPQGRVLRAPLAFPHLIDALSGFESRQHRIVNFEMETAAMYGLANLLGHQALSVSVVVANRISQTFSSDGDAAIDQMIRTSLEFIEKI